MLGERQRLSFFVCLAYIAIGHVAGAVGSDMKLFLEAIMTNIKQALQMRGYALTVFSVSFKVLN